MKIKYNLLNFFAVCLLMAYGICGCAEYSENEPLDIVKGEVDLQGEYYKSILKSPSLVTGKITNKSTQNVMSKVKVTAREENSKTTYSTLSKEDGSFSMYVEGKKTYIFYGEMEGFEKSYYANGTDTTFYVESSYSSFNANIAMKVYDPTPKFKVNYISSNYLSYTSTDISFNGTYLVTNDKSDYFARYWDFKGYMKESSSFIFGIDFFTCQGSASFWAGKANKYSLYNIDSKTGNLLSTVTCQVPTSGTDVEVYNNNFWMLSGKTIYKLSMTGELLTSLDLTKNAGDWDTRGIVKKDNHLYLLNYSKGESQFLLYKIDPATLKVVSKGYLPDTFKNKTFKGLTFDNTNFWISDGVYVYKFSTVE